MRIGVLICDDLNDGLDTWRTHDISLFRDLLGPGFRVDGWSVFRGEAPPPAHACDGWVIGGSRASAFDGDPWVRTATDHIRGIVSAGLPLLGICFGHQLIHQALGGEVHRSERGWGLGLYPVTVTEAAQGLGLTDDLRLPAVHQDQVTRPAPGFERLAGNDFCPWYLTRCGRTLTVQGHPEFDRPFYEAVLARVARRVSAERIGGARDSLAERDDTERFRHALRAFFLRYGGDRSAA